jgi:hypothetical protein
MEHTVHILDGLRGEATGTLHPAPLQQVRVQQVQADSGQASQRGLADDGDDVGVQP